MPIRRPFLRPAAALLIAVTLGLGGCATLAPLPNETSPTAPASAPAIGIPPVAEGPGIPAPVILSPDLPAAATPKPATPAPAYPAEREIRASVLRLLPAKVTDRNAWAADIQTAFSALRIWPSRENICSAMAVIEQESSWQADPVVPGLGAIVWKELYAKAARYGVPQFVVDMAMLKSSPGGRSYRSRIDSLRTEREMNALYEDMVSELPDAARALGGRNPIRTGGPMQVGVEFAEAQVKEKTYPYPIGDSVRHEVFSRRGGLYFGIAMLLDYPGGYSAARYWFADFNAGRYSSRNAAFQDALARLSRRVLDRDGDLLRYQDGRVLRQPGESENALALIAPRLRMNAAEIRRDLLLEKTAGFSRSVLWQRLFALADASAGTPVPREVMPRIALKSPKIHRKLTTEWFALKVEGRYQSCLARAPF